MLHGSSSHWPFDARMAAHCSAPFSLLSLSSGLPASQFVYISGAVPFHVQPAPGVAAPGACSRPIHVADATNGVTQLSSAALSIWPSLPIQPTHAVRAASNPTLPVHTAQQLPPHLNADAVPPPPQTSPVGSHGSRAASIGSAASTGASGGASGSGGLASTAGASRSEQRPTTQRCGIGQPFVLSHGAPSCSTGL